MNIYYYAYNYILAYKELHVSFLDSACTSTNTRRSIEEGYQEEAANAAFAGDQSLELAGVKLKTMSKVPKFIKFKAMIIKFKS